MVGACVQPWYVTPAGWSRHLERGAIHAIDHAANDWLAARDGGRRIRICGKVLVFKTPAVLPVPPDGTLVYTFDKLIPAPADRINLVFYDAPRTYVGGWADMPPTIPGHTALIALGGQATWPDTWKLEVLHELLHTFGIGHVLDDRYDLMSSPRDMGGIHLDPSHTHYWAQLMASPYLI